MFEVLTACLGTVSTHESWHMVVNGITIKIHLKDWESEETFKKLLDKEVDRLNNIFFPHKIEGMVAIPMELPQKEIKNISISIPDYDCSGDKTRKAFDELLSYLSTMANRIEYTEVESIQYELNDYVETGILRPSKDFNDGASLNPPVYVYDLLKYQ